MKLLVLLLAIIFQLSIANEKILKQVKTCDFPNKPENRNKCFRTLVNMLVGEFRQTRKPVMGFFVPEPLNIGTFPFKQNSGPLNIAAEFVDAKLYGLSDFSVLDATTDYDVGLITFYVAASPIQLEGQYIMNGNVLLLPLEGSGDFFVTAKGATMNLTSRMAINKKDSRFMTLEDMVLDVKINEGADMHFLNLFEGDDVLDETMHHFLNTNYELVYEEVIPHLTIALKEFLLKAFGGLFSHIPLKDIYPSGVVGK